MERAKGEMLEKMKRKGAAYLDDVTESNIELVKVTVQELNPPVTSY